MAITCNHSTATLRLNSCQSLHSWVLKGRRKHLEDIRKAGTPKYTRVFSIFTPTTSHARYFRDLQKNKLYEGENTWLRNETKLTFYGGVNEIGGNKILLHRSTGFLDFGMSFTAKKSSYSPPFLSPRDERQPSRAGYSARIDGVYKFDQSRADIDAVFLSHGHLDHSAYLSFIKREIPVYCGETTQTIFQTLSGIRRADLEFNVADINFNTFRTDKK